jgi:hypothetical protein
MKYTLILLILTGVCACNSQKRLVGTYLSENSDVTSSVVLILQADGEFTVKSRSDVAGYFITNGQWRKSQDTVYFDVKPDKFDQSEFNYSYDPSYNTVKVEAYRKRDSTGLYFVKLYLNGSETPMDTIRTGVFFARADSIQSIRMNLNGDIIELKPPHKKANRFIFYWDFESTRPSVLVSKTWKVQGRKLIPLEPGFSIFRKKIN